MTWSASKRSASTSPRAAKNWKVPTRMWLDATRVSTAPGSAVSRITRPPVATARERWRPRAFELDVATDAVRAHDLAQQNGAAIAQLRHEVPELVPGIGERDRLGTRRDVVARQDDHTLRRRQRFGIEAELGGERRVELDQARGRDR